MSQSYLHWSYSVIEEFEVRDLTNGSRNPIFIGATLS